MDDRDRRRVGLAVLVTLAAAPVIAFSGSSSSAPPDVVPDTVVEGNSTEQANSLPPSSPGSAPPVFMDGPATVTEQEPVAIAVPGEPSAEIVATRATFRSTVPTGRCLVDGVSIRTARTVTVVNLDNGRSISCLTTLGPASQTDPLVLNPSNFSELADLTDAPIPVELRM